MATAATGEFSLFATTSVGIRSLALPPSLALYLQCIFCILMGMQGTWEQTRLEKIPFP